jgi:hypothetical protein
MLKWRMRGWGKSGMHPTWGLAGCCALEEEFGTEGNLVEGEKALRSLKGDGSIAQLEACSPAEPKIGGPNPCAYKNLFLNLEHGI